MSPITALNTILGPAGRGLLGYRLPCRRPAQYLLATPAIQFRSTIFRRCNASIAHATVQDQVVYDGNFGVSSGLTMPDTFHSGHTYPVPPEKRTSRQEPLGSKPAPEAPQNMRGNDSQVSLAAVTVPAYHRGSKFERNPYWQRIGRWKGVTETKFLSHQWNVWH